MIRQEQLGQGFHSVSLQISRKELRPYLFTLEPDALVSLVEKYRQREYADDIEFLHKELQGKRL